MVRLEVARLFSSPSPSFPNEVGWRALTHVRFDGSNFYELGARAPFVEPLGLCIPPSHSIQWDSAELC